MTCLTRSLAPRAAGRRRSRRGFTLLELVVVLAVTAFLFAFLLDWVLTLAGVSATNLDAAASERSSTSITSVLDADFAGAVVCPATGTPLAATTTTTLALYTRPTGAQARDGIELVTWAMDGTTLTRSSTPATLAGAACGPTDPSVRPSADPSTLTWDTYTTRATVTPAGASAVIYAFTDQAPVGAGVVTVALTLDAADSTTAPAHVGGTYTLPTTYQGLS